MDLEMVLNELSFQPPALDVQTAKFWMSELVSTVLTATKVGVKRVLRTHSEFHATVLAPDYPLLRWRNDNSVDRELRRYFNTITTKSPFLVDLEGSETETESLLSEFRCEEEQVYGLGVAYLLEALALSVRSDSRWDTDRIKLVSMQLEDDQHFNSTLVEVIHASRVEHVQTHSNWILERLKLGIRHGTDLWNRRDELFPHLIFCESVKDQIYNLGADNPVLQQVRKRLFELETYCRDWQQGAFNKDNLPCKANPESEATLKQYSREHTFLCPDGKERLFSWHVYFTPGAGRIFFNPQAETKNFIIGHIGPKLPNVKF